MKVRKEELILSDLCCRTDIMDLSSYFFKEKMHTIEYMLPFHPWKW